MKNNKFCPVTNSMCREDCAFFKSEQYIKYMVLDERWWDSAYDCCMFVSGDYNCFREEPIITEICTFNGNNILYKNNVPIPHGFLEVNKAQYYDTRERFSYWLYGRRQQRY